MKTSPQLTVGTLSNALFKCSDDAQVCLYANENHISLTSVNLEDDGQLHLYEWVDKSPMTVGDLQAATLNYPTATPVQMDVGMESYNVIGVDRDPDGTAVII